MEFLWYLKNHCENKVDGFNSVPAVTFGESGEFSTDSRTHLSVSAKNWGYEEGGINQPVQPFRLHPGRVLEGFRFLKRTAVQKLKTCPYSLIFSAP